MSLKVSVAFKQQQGLKWGLQRVNLGAEIGEFGAEMGHFWGVDLGVEMGAELGAEIDAVSSHTVVRRRNKTAELHEG
ncbi:hypothetical protein Tco_0397016 [Tanacetum coccineum]